MVFENNLDLTLQESPGFKGAMPADYTTTPEMKGRLDSIVSRIQEQHKQYKSASLNTSKAFHHLLEEFNNVTGYLKEALEQSSLNPYKVFYEIDSDRSVGILNLFWNSVSFTTRGNISPKAVIRKNDSPLIAGRIIALKGDFHDAALELHDQEFPELIACEIASLYIPHDPQAKSIAKFKEGEPKEIYYNQEEAPREFLLKVVELACASDDYHEEDIDYLED